MKLYKEHLESQKRRMNLGLPFFEEAQKEEDPKKRLALLHKCKPMAFADYKGAMPEGDKELREQQQLIADYNQQMPKLFDATTEIVEEIEARERMEEMLEKQRNAFKLHLHTQETMVSAVENKLEKVRAIQDVRDRVYELEQLQ